MTVKHRTARISKALEEMKQAARVDIARRRILHFRIGESNILEIYEMAATKKQPVGTMVREWVLERLKQEQGGSSNNKLHDIEKRVNTLERRLPPARKRATV
jgi:hypothetical protein